MIQSSKYNFSVGDTVKIIFRLSPQSKTRTTPFEGTVIALRGAGEDKTFTIRKLATAKVAVERIFPLNSPVIEDVKVLAQKDVRRAKLYYLRDR